VPNMGSAWAAVDAYARAVVQRDPLAHARGLDLAEAVLALAPAARRAVAS
jgi:hypothetical protein